ncbi:MAG: restriction endonuclease subunit S [Serratia fonticola]
MTGNEKRPLVPRLRFPEFKEAKSWGFLPLTQLAKRSTRKNINCEITRVLTNSAEYGVVDQRDFFDKDIANQGNLKGYYIVEEGAYVYNPRISATAPVGPISKNKIGLGVMSPLYTVFKFNSSKNEFYAYYFKSTHWHQYMRQASSTGARHDRMSITNDDFMSLPLPVSTPEEQQKIADCLSSLDELLSAEIQKLDILKTHKKGLMQQLFPREGETVPRLRFPEFRDAAEWNVKTLDNLAENLDNRRVPVTGKDRTKGNIPYYGASGIVDYVNNFIFDEELLCVSEDGANLVARTTPIAFSISGKTWVNNHAHVLRFERKCIQQIVEDYLNSISLEDYLTGMAQPKLNRTMLDTIPVPVPWAEDEQQAVADCLSSLNDLIATQSQKVELLKTQKKGLMHQLFPIEGKGKQ